MRYCTLGVAVLLPLTASLAWAQGSSGPSGPPGMMNGRMRMEIEQRFAERVRKELQLTDDQAARLRTTIKTYATNRQALREREQALRAALADQLRPGIAAVDDSVAHLTDGLLDLRVEYMQSYHDESKELGKFLTPVQRAQLLIMREQVTRAVREARDRRPRPPDGNRLDRP